MRYRWVILGVGVLAQSALAGVFFGLPVLAPELQDEYRLSLGELGALFAASNVGGIVTLLPWGLLTDRLGERVSIAVGLGGLSAGFLAAAALPPYWALFLLVTAAGASGVSVSAASGRAVMGWFAASQRGLALGLRQASVPVGGALVSLGLPPLLAAGGLGVALAALGLWALGAGALAVVLLRDPPREEETLVDLTSPLRDARLWRLSIGSTFYVCVQIGITSFLVLYLHEERGLSLAAAGAAAAAIHVIGGIGRVGFGALSDRLGSRMSLLRAIGVAMAVAVAAAAALLPVPLALVVPLLVLAGGLSMCWNGLSFTAAAELAGRRRTGAALGVQQTMLAAGCVVMPVLFASLVDASSWRIAFGALAVLPLLGWRVLGPLS
jgi:nitrate/nitrite transporter NarK